MSRGVAEKKQQQKINIKNKTKKTQTGESWEVVQPCAQSLAFQCRRKSTAESAEILSLPAPREAPVAIDRAVHFLLPLMGWGRRTAVIHSFNKHSFLLLEEGSQGEDDVDSALKWLII